MTQISSFLKNLIDGFVALTFPLNCLSCGDSLSIQSTILCKKCESELPLTGFENDDYNPVFQSFWGRAPVEFATSAYFFRKGERLQYLIHLLKYRSRPDVGIYLGSLIGRLILSSTKFSKIDFLIPVPLHPKRLRQRGYNQSEKIAEGISDITGIEILTDVLIRKVYSVSQTSKGLYERWENVDGIFEIIFESLLVNKNILLIDDIMTTGSTLEACISAFKKVDGVNVYVFTVGYTSFR